MYRLHRQEEINSSTTYFQYLSSSSKKEIAFSVAVL
jgi:hypothetical protein